MIDPDGLPVFVHCLDGRIVTGVAMMALRRLQMWTLPSTITEYQQ